MDAHEKINLEEMLTTNEVAAILKKHPVTIRRMVNRKKNPLPCRRIGGTLRFWPQEINDWIERHGTSSQEVSQFIRSKKHVLGEIAKI